MIYDDPKTDIGYAMAWNRIVCEPATAYRNLMFWLFHCTDCGCGMEPYPFCECVCHGDES